MVVPRKTLRDYAVCAGVFGFAAVFAPLDGVLPFSLARLGMASAVLGVAATTFRWGTAIGYPPRDKAGHLCPGHFIRSLAMTGIMTIVVVGASMPLLVIVGAMQKR